MASVGNGAGVFERQKRATDEGELPGRSRLWVLTALSCMVMVVLAAQTGS